MFSECWLLALKNQDKTMITGCDHLAFIFVFRALVERLVTFRPHPWGLLVLFTELIRNPAYNFWDHEYLRCSPYVERYVAFIYTQDKLIFYLMFQHALMSQGSKCFLSNSTWKNLIFCMHPQDSRMLPRFLSRYIHRPMHNQKHHQIAKIWDYNLKNLCLIRPSIQVWRQCTVSFLNCWLRLHKAKLFS